MKGNPADLRELGNSVDRALHDHPDAIRHNPDIAAELFRIRNTIRERYDRINENRDRGLGLTGFDQHGDLIP